MNERSKQRLTRCVSVLFSNEEYEKLQQRLASSTCWTMSEYCRKVLMDKPIVVFHRDQALDEFLQEAILLRKSLQQVGQEGRQFTPLLNEIKNCINKIYDYVRQNKT